MNVEFITYNNEKTKRFHQFLYKEIEAFNNLGANLKVCDFQALKNLNNYDSFLNYEFNISIYDILSNIDSYVRELKHSNFVLHKYRGIYQNYLDGILKLQNDLILFATENFYFEFSVKVNTKDNYFCFNHSFVFSDEGSFFENYKTEVEFVEDKLKQTFLALNFILQKKFDSFNRFIEPLSI